MSRLLPTLCFLLLRTLLYCNSFLISTTRNKMKFEVLMAMVVIYTYEIERKEKKLQILIYNFPPNFTSWLHNKFSSVGPFDPLTRLYVCDTHLLTWVIRITHFLSSPTSSMEGKEDEFQEGFGISSYSWVLVCLFYWFYF